MDRLCKICGKKRPLEVCEYCGKKVCRDCLDKDLNLCLDCLTSRKRDLLEISPQTIMNIGTIMILGGIGLMILASILGMMLGTAEGFILVGVFPFLFGYGASSPLLSLISLLMFLLPVVLFLYPWIRSRSELEERKKIVVEREGREVPESLSTPKKRSEREEEQIIAVSVPKNIQKEISIQIVGGRLVIEGKEGEAFEKSFNFPNGTKPVKFKSEYIEDHELLVVRVKVRREESLLEK
ncbi:MAG: Hsp20/alpha crystallin family protein [Candidatus Bathyarchaeota archaeon]|nr:MAG: Hsp20/alpha crystallin family protein [Candidatus Bathyarchaeota archaeon]